MDLALNAVTVVQVWDVRNMKLIKMMLSLWFGMFILWLSILGGIGYVAWHFISKFW